MIEIFHEAFWGSLKSVWTIARIIIPIMVILQILKDYNILGKITGKFLFLAGLFKITNESILSLLVGIIFGLAFGAGVIIQSAKEGNLGSRDLFLITVFLATCHAVFEDTLIFMSVGANGLILLGSRIAAAFILTFILSRRSNLVPAKIKL